MRLSDWTEIERLDGEWGQYRVRTVALLRKYLRMATESGRLPSLLGREFFRTAITSYGTHTFEDAVIFVIDMERALEALCPEHQAVIVRVVFQEYFYEEAAALLGISPSTMIRRIADAFDALARILVGRGMLDRVHDSVSATTVKLLSRADALPPKIPVSGVRDFLRAENMPHPKFCQVAKNAKITVSA